MVLPRTSYVGGIFRSQATRSAGARAQAWQKPGRRFYASEHAHATAKPSSDLPWLIGSIAVTVPSATWLWQQGPEKKPHGHGHGAEQLGLHDEGAEASPGGEKEEESIIEAVPPDSLSADESEKVRAGGEANEGTSSETGATHPSMGDPEKSTKGEDVPETAKISGTVDTSRDAV